VRGSSVSLREAYRVLRANLLVALADAERASVMFTSALPGEGKTTTVVGVAKALAMAGQQVAVVDFDLRHPDVHRVLGLVNEIGVSEVLLDKAEVADCLQFVEVDHVPGHPPGGLHALAAGATLSDPAELIGGPNVARLLDAVSHHADVVLIDAPPMLAVADALVLGRVVTGAVLVVEARRTPTPAVQRAKEALTRNQIRILGVVVNKQHRRDGSDPGYGGYPGDHGAERAAIATL
jgi:succinoglycan biosynthesis transport protein ExoP